MSEPKPFVIRGADGSIVDVRRTDEKGFKKTIEQRTLWTRHAETGRLLPANDLPPATDCRDRGGWYEAVLGSDSKIGEGSVAGAPSGPPSGGAASSATSAAPTSSPARVGGAAEDVLPRLYALIESRKREMPEGSYTTHLFAEGPAKIRKKTGEEAIELLLAESRGEHIHEAADLIYHLLVMLVDSGIAFEDLLQELRSR